MFLNIKRLLFSSNEKCLYWYQRIVSFNGKVTKLDDLFAFRFYSWHMNDENKIQSEFDKCMSLNNDLKTKYKIF
jgi:hypothetical protein